MSGYYILIKWGLIMKRKVIQIAESTQLISLPRTWAKKYNVKKGDELEVEEKGNKVEISTDISIKPDKITINVDNLDRSSIMYFIRGAYRRGYETIEIVFNKDVAYHYREKKDAKIISIIHEEVNRLVGVEVIQQKENFCVIKDISTVSFKEFDNILRRVFRLFLDASQDMFDGIKKDDFILIETIEEKHNSITKFISYALRLLNRNGFPESYKNSILYTIIVLMDKITDVLKYAGRDIVHYKLKLSKPSISLIEKVYKSYERYYRFFYKYSKEDVVVMYKNRDEIMTKFRALKNKLSKDELLVLNDIISTLEYVVGMTEARISLELNQ